MHERALSDYIISRSWYNQIVDALRQQTGQTTDWRIGGGFVYEHAANIALGTLIRIDQP